jgi:hypothetical protein
MLAPRPPPLRSRPWGPTDPRGGKTPPPPAGARHDGCLSAGVIGRAHRGLHGDRPPGAERDCTRRGPWDPKGRSAAEDGAGQAFCLAMQSRRERSERAAAENGCPAPLPSRSASGRSPAFEGRRAALSGRWRTAQRQPPSFRPPCRSGRSENAAAVLAPETIAIAGGKLAHEMRAHSDRTKPMEVDVEVGMHGHEVARLDAGGCRVLVQAR